jgi:hypothetical protein
VWGTKEVAMKVFSTICLLGVLVAAFAVAAVTTLERASAGDEPSRASALAASFDGSPDATGPQAVTTGAPERLLAVMRELLDGRDVECERIVRLLVGIDENARIDDEHIFRLLLGLEGDADIDRDHIAEVLGVEADETVDCEWLFRRMLGLDEGEAIDNEQLVRLLLGIDESDDLDTEQVVKLLEHAVAAEKPGR